MVVIRGSGVAAGSSEAVTWHVELIRACDVAGGVVGGSDVVGRVVSSGDMAVGVDDDALAWPNWAFMRGGSGAGNIRWGGGMVVVGGKDVIGQCLATGGCQTSKLLIINILIFN